MRTARWNLRWVLVSLAAFMLSVSVLTGISAAAEVVVYTAVDQPVAEPILRDFEKQTGIKVILRMDVEATKTAGLAERLRAERSNPQADVWWSNEIFHTINLAEEGVLASYESPAAAEIPSLYKDPQHRWAGVALRARVIGVTTDPAGAAGAQSVKSLADLTNPSLKGKIAMAKPSFGTTGGHVAALYAVWGQEKADQYFQSLKNNGIKMLGGNSVVAQTVGSGQAFAGLTDNDDVDAVLANGGKIAMVLPDQGQGQLGTLTIPSTTGLVAGAKHVEEGKKLVDYLLSREVEKRMIDAKFARYSVFDSSGDRAVRAMQVDYREAARLMPQAVQRVLAILEGRQ